MTRPRWACGPTASRTRAPQKRARPRAFHRRGTAAGRQPCPGRPPQPGVLAAIGELLHLWCLLQRHNRGPLRPPLHRPRHSRGHGRERPGHHGRDELRRHAGFGLAHRPLRSEEAPGHLLLAQGLSLLLLPFVTEFAGLTVFAVFFGLDYIATVPPTVALVADRFGRANVGAIFGWVFFGHQIGAALASYLGGVVRVS